ncbi:MAG: calcium:proton antiporter, partial [Burkholderiaceae bacterium]
WTTVVPVAACAVLVGSSVLSGVVLYGLVSIALVATVLAAVHHAEVIALRVGEPFGTLVLALCVTLIEVALILSMMLASGEAGAAIARDTVYATVMLVLTGIVGLSLFAGGLHHLEQSFQLDGVGAALSTLAAIATLTLVFPVYTTTTPGPSLDSGQLGVIALSALVLYGTFIFTQTIQHRPYFLDAGDGFGEATAARPVMGLVALSSALLLVSLVAVVLLAKTLAPGLEAALADAGAPPAAVGVLIAALVLMPEGLSAVRAARAGRLQTSLNLGLGSALASIGLTIPVVAAFVLMTGTPLVLGIDSRSTALLLLAFFVVSLALRTGRTILLHGVVLLVVLAVYLYTTFVP